MTETAAPQLSAATEAFLKKMETDKAFAETILQQDEVEKVIELAAAEGIAITSADIDEANEVIRKVFELQQTEGELSEEELENVAGGTALATIIGTLLSVASLGIITAFSSLTAGATISFSIIATKIQNKS